MRISNRYQVLSVCAGPPQRSRFDSSVLIRNLVLQQDRSGSCSLIVSIHLADFQHKAFSLPLNFQ